MKNDVVCQCGQLHGTVEMTRVVLRFNSVRKKDNGLKFQLSYNVQGTFLMDAAKNLLRCAECSGYAMTKADWQAAKELKSVTVG